MVTTSSTGERDKMSQKAWTVTDWTEDLALDCDTDDADLGDTLGTLIYQLIQLGILKGSVTTA